MCGRARAFYVSLFFRDLTNPDTCRVLWTGLPMVSMGDRDRLELPLTLAELSEALCHITTDKSPGMDWLTVEFYHKPRSPCSQRRGTPATFGIDSLLSTDYKVIAKAISLQLGSMLEDVVHPDQTYTILGWTIFDNLYLDRDILELGCRDRDILELSFSRLSLDQEEAFNRVDHGYLLGTLWAFSFRPQFVVFLQVLYASTECLVRLNWTLTELVSPGHGVHQGCLLSGQLYALATEPFLCRLRQRLIGLELWEPDLWLVLLAYADDVLLLVQDLGDLVPVKACQAIYSVASSARVNWVKSSGLVVGDGWQVSGPGPPAMVLVQSESLEFKFGDADEKLGRQITNDIGKIIVMVKRDYLLREKDSGHLQGAELDCRTFLFRGYLHWTAVNKTAFISKHRPHTAMTDVKGEHIPEKDEAEHGYV
ncbi:unnamed protein product [Caretta caretta]